MGQNTNLKQNFQGLINEVPYAYAQPNFKDKYFLSLTTKIFSGVPVPEFIDPCFRENQPKTLVFSHRKRAFWACFRENWVYNFGHGLLLRPFVRVNKDREFHTWAPFTYKLLDQDPCSE